MVHEREEVSHEREEVSHEREEVYQVGYPGGIPRWIPWSIHPGLYILVYMPFLYPVVGIPRPVHASLYPRVTEHEHPLHPSV